MGWIILLWFGVLTAVTLLGFGAYALFDSYGKKRQIKRIFSYILIALMITTIAAGILFTGKLTQTESFKRFKKSWDSEFDGGITREITVYLENGDVIYNIEGKFDVEHSDERLKWVDENGKVQIIYLGRSSTAVVNEK